MSEAEQSFLDEFLAVAEQSARDYARIHKRRFLHTLSTIPKAQTPHDMAIEFGTYGMFLLALQDLAGYRQADGTVWEEHTPHKILSRLYPFDKASRSFRLFNVNLEMECLPLPESQYDLVLCAEVLEHMSIDPMALLWEANRVLKIGGKLMLTTPNACCAENIERILWRQVPNSYYFYRKTRNSDRHNLEYGPDLLIKAVEAAGFAVEKIWTEDCWFEPRHELVEWFRQKGYPVELRGDNLFLIGTKIGPPLERLPDFLYD